MSYFRRFCTKRERVVRKCWSCLFFCLIIGALCSKLAFFSNIDHILYALSIFIAGRGGLKSIFIDNSSNFGGVGASLGAIIYILGQNKIENNPNEYI